MKRPNAELAKAPLKDYLNRLQLPAALHWELQVQLEGTIDRAFIQYSNPVRLVQVEKIGVDTYA